MVKLFGKFVAILTVGSLLMDPSYGYLVSSPDSRAFQLSQPAEDAFAKQAVVPALLRMHTAFSRLTFQQVKATTSLLAAYGMAGAFRTLSAQTPSFIETPDLISSPLIVFSFIVGNYFAVKAVDDLAKARYYRTAGVLAVLHILTTIGFTVYLVADFNPLSLSSWLGPYLRLSHAAPLGVPLFVWSTVAAGGIAIYEARGWLKARQLNRLPPTRREVLSGERRFVVYAKVRQVITSSRFWRITRRGLIAGLLALAAFIAPQTSSRIAPRIEKAITEPSSVPPIVSNFSAILPQRNPMHNAGSYFLKTFTIDQSQSILSQKAVRISLRALDGKDIRQFKVWVHSRGGQTISILAGARVGPKNWFRTQGSELIISDSTRDAYVDVPVSEIQAYLRVLNLIEGKPANMFDLGAIAVEMNSETGVTWGSTISSKAEAKLDAFSDAGKAMTIPGPALIRPALSSPNPIPVPRIRGILVAA